MAKLDEHISGSMVRSHLEALRRKVGDDRYRGFVETLSAADQEQLLLVTPLSWVRIETLERLYGAIAPSLGMTIETLHVEVASVVVGQAVTSLWRALLNLATDAMLIARSPTIFKRAYKQGRLEVVRAGDGTAELKISEWPLISEFALRGMRVGIESTLRAAGRKEPRGVARRTADGAIIKLEWTVD